MRTHMNARMNDIVSQGRVAVITGAQQGIGAEFARRLAGRGMALVLVDRDAAKLNALARSLKTNITVAAGDVTDADFVSTLRDTVAREYGPVSLLVNNAGIKQDTTPWDDPLAWQNMMEVNLWAVLRLQSLFVPAMLAEDMPAAIVNVGSKEGITTPPGNVGYSVSKAAIKVLTEQLQHELRAVSGDRVSAHLLVPGYVGTAMNFPTPSDLQNKPDTVWTPADLMDYALPRLLNGDFYIICPDGDVTSQTDALRIRWAAEDMVQNRPALSRWHPRYRSEFSRWIEAAQ